MSDEKKTKPRIGAPLKRGVKKLTFSGRATPDVCSFLKSRVNASEWIEDAVRRTKAFRDWIEKK